MDQRMIVTTTQDFLLFNCSSEQYSINFSESLLSPNNTYTVQYAYPNKSTKGVVAEYVRDNQLLVKSPPEFDHPCTVHVEVYTNGNEQCIAKFSLDLVSPVEYLFRKYSLDDNKMCSSDKMTSALLAMSLSYYCVMEEQMKKERKAADKILATLLTCNGNSVPPKHTTSVQSTTSTRNIKQFAERHQLQRTLQCLPTTVDFKDLPSNGHHAPLTNVKSTNNSGPSEYAELITTTKPDHYSLVNGNGQSGQTETPCDYEVPHSHKLIKHDHSTPTRRCTTIQPPTLHEKKLRRTSSLDSILSKDHEYAYVEPPRVVHSDYPSSPRLPPPRPPPPRLQNKLATPPSTKKSMSNGHTNSDPSSPTLKRRWWRKDKQ